MTFNGNLEKLGEFIDQFKSYLESIENENESIQGLMSGFSASISMTGGYDDAIEGKRNKFVSSASALKENLQATVTELIKLKTQAEKAASRLGSLDPKMQNIDKTV